VTLQRFQDKLCGTNHIAEPQVLSHRVDFLVPCSQISHLESLGAKDIRVRGPTGPPEDNLAPEGAGGLSNKVDDPGVFRDEEPIVISLDLTGHLGMLSAAVHGGLVACYGLLEAADHVRRLGFKFGFVVAPGFPLDRHGVGDDVDGVATVDDPNVGRGLLVQAAESHPRDCFTRDPNGVDPLLWTDARVGLETLNGKM
jgi:hypothetical protein